MLLHIVVNLSKQPPLTVKKTLENLQVQETLMHCCEFELTTVDRRK